MVGHVTFAQRLGEQGIQGVKLLPGQLGQRHHQLIRNRLLGLKGAGIGEFLKGIRIRKRPPGRRHGVDRQGQRVGAVDRRPREVQLGCQRLDTVGALLIRCLLEAPIAMQRDGAAHWGIGALAPCAVLNVEFLIKEAPPENDRFPR